MSEPVFYDANGKLLRAVIVKHAHQRRKDWRYGEAPEWRSFLRMSWHLAKGRRDQAAARGDFIQRGVLAGLMAAHTGGATTGLSKLLGE